MTASIWGKRAKRARQSGQINGAAPAVVHDAEIALATRAPSLVIRTSCEVLIGGLGLGYTAKAALDCERVESVTVIERLDRVIDGIVADLFFVTGGVKSGQGWAWNIAKIVTLRDL